MYSGKHHDHGVNVQGLTSTGGVLLYLGEARPGSTHELTAARADGIVDAVTGADVETTADSGHQGAGGTVRTPVNARRAKATTAGRSRPRAPWASSAAPASGSAARSSSTTPPCAGPRPEAWTWNRSPSSPRSRTCPVRRTACCGRWPATRRRRAAGAAIGTRNSRC
ncbi:transposase family protein [Streptomyces sp. NPDC059862]|uniref:transposase family protein n=1 Tax=Streptomyces sp. NPDC059862 TaxID=3346975 RepID=UPI003667584B